jgi:hypothetical protein
MAVQHCCRGATSSGFFGLRAQLGRSATSTVVSSAMAGSEEPLREVSAYSTGQSELGLGAAGSRRQRGKVNRLRWTIRQMPRRFRKACNLPVSPRLLTASCHPTCVQNNRVRSFGRNARQFVQPVQTAARSGLAFAAISRVSHSPCSKPTRHETSLGKF